MNKIDSISNEIYVIGDFNINLSLNDSYINNLLPKFEEVPNIAKSTNAAIIGISESKLGQSVLEPEIQIYDYKILRCDRNRHGGGVAFYIRNDLSYNISVFPHKIESAFFEIL